VSLRQPLFPVALEVGGRECLVVGAGPVATRKAEALLGSGAVVTVVAPDVDQSMLALAQGPVGTAGGSLQIEQRPYRAGEAAEYRLVITSTGIPEVDGAVFADAEAAQVWVNSADDVEHCTSTAWCRSPSRREGRARLSRRGCAVAWARHLKRGSAPWRRSWRRPAWR